MGMNRVITDIDWGFDKQDDVIRSVRLELQKHRRQNLADLDAVLLFDDAQGCAGQLDRRADEERG